MPINIKNSLMSKLMIEHRNYDGVEYEIMMDPMILEIDILPAL